MALGDPTSDYMDLDNDEFHAFTDRMFDDDTVTPFDHEDASSTSRCVATQRTMASLHADVIGSVLLTSLSWVVVALNGLSGIRKPIDFES